MQYFSWERIFLFSNLRHVLWSMVKLNPFMQRIKYLENLQISDNCWAFKTYRSVQYCTSSVYLKHDRIIWFTEIYFRKSLFPITRHVFSWMFQNTCMVCVAGWNKTGMKQTAFKPLQKLLFHAFDSKDLHFFCPQTFSSHGFIIFNQ